MAATDVSVVVVTWECADHLSGLVESMNEFLSADAELVVVDNGSVDAPDLKAAAWQGRLHFENTEQNLGFGPAANRGVELASGGAVVLLNPDARLLDDRLPQLAEFALSAGALAGPRLRNPDGSRQPSASGDPVGLWPWLGAFVPGAVQPKYMRRHVEPWRLDTATPVGWLSGACIAGPRDLLLELGPFDPGIHMYAEDMDLCLRAARDGVESWFRPDLCEVSHLRRGSSTRRWETGPEGVAAQSRRQVIARLHGASAERRSWWAQRAFLAARLGAKRVLRRPAPAEARELEALRAALPPDRHRELPPRSR